MKEFRKRILTVERDYYRGIREIRLEMRSKIKAHAEDNLGPILLYKSERNIYKTYDVLIRLRLPDFHHMLEFNRLEIPDSISMPHMQYWENRWGRRVENRNMILEGTSEIHKVLVENIIKGNYKIRLPEPEYRPALYQDL